MKHYDTIIGGGISGCVLGYLLVKQKIKLEIINTDHNFTDKQDEFMMLPERYFKD